MKIWDEIHWIEESKEVWREEYNVSKLNTKSSSVIIE